jgi:hypothetical protein
MAARKSSRRIPPWQVLTSDDAPKDADAERIASRRAPTNIDRINSEMPAVRWVDEAVVPNEVIAERIEDHIGAVGHAFSGNEQLEQVVVALRDLLYSVAPAFAPADSVSVFGEDDWSAWQENTAEVGPSRIHAVGSATEAVTVIQTNLVHVRPYGSIAATRREITFDAMLIQDPRGRLHRYIDWTFVMAQLGIVGSQRPMLGMNPTKGGIVKPKRRAIPSAARNRRAGGATRPGTA